MPGPRYTALTSSLPASVPFVGPEAQERARARPFHARIGANESVFGPSPRAVEAMQEAAKDTWMYGDPENHDLRQALAKHEKTDPANIIIGEGIDGLLGYLTRMLVGPGDAVVTSDGAYPTFNYHVTGYGGTLHKVPYTGDHEDPDALIAKASETRAKLIYLSNPDNPMGTWHDAATIERMVTEIPDGTLLVLDEAYAQFLPAGTISQIDPGDPRVIRFRTFSKAYGMAGARVGYCIGHPELITAFNKVRNHFGMARVSQAGALAALEDQKHLEDVLTWTATARTRIAEIATAQGLHALPSAANFVAIDCGRDGDFARTVLAELINRDVFVRMPFVAPQDRCIRVSAGTENDLDTFETAFSEALSVARAEL